MSKKEGYSRQGLFGTIHHYDSKGHKVGESRPGIFGLTQKLLYYKFNDK